MNTIRLLAAFAVIGSLSACGKESLIDYTCDEPERYQAVNEHRKVTAPEGLDELNEFAEMPIPRAEGAPERPPGSRCIELPPSAGTTN